MLSADNWAQRKLNGLKARGQSRDHEYVFLTSCIGARGEDIDAMTDDDVQVEVTYEEMLEHCDLSGFEEEMGYDPEGLMLKDDTMVSYYRSVYRGCPCYFLSHSRIEYIYVKADEWEPEVVKQNTCEHQAVDINVQYFGPDTLLQGTCDHCGVSMSASVSSEDWTVDEE